MIKALSDKRSDRRKIGAHYGLLGCFAGAAFLWANAALASEVSSEAEGEEAADMVNDAPAPEFDLSGLSISGGLGTSGINMGAAYRFNEIFGARGSFGWFPFPQSVLDDIANDVSTDIGGSSYSLQNASLDLSIGHFALMGDVYATPPDQNFQFRGSLGLMRANLALSAGGDINQSVIFPSTGDIIPVKSAKGEASFGGILPYIGMGMDLGAKEGWGFSVDLGLGINPDVDVSMSAVATNPAEQATLDSNMKTEQDALLTDDYDTLVDSLKVLPYVSLNLAYHF